MTDTDRIAQMAREADAYADQYMRDNAHLRPDWIDVRDARFARLVAEDCAKVCDEKAGDPDNFVSEAEKLEVGQHALGWWGGSINCAQAIRARYSKEG